MLVKRLQGTDYDRDQKYWSDIREVWIHLAQDKVERQAFVSTVIKFWSFF
jgi:hypothetical protein